MMALACNHSTWETEENLKSQVILDRIKMGGHLVALSQTSTLALQDGKLVYTGSKQKLELFPHMVGYSQGRTCPFSVPARASMTSAHKISIQAVVLWMRMPRPQTTVMAECVVISVPGGRVRSIGGSKSSLATQ